MLSPEPRIQRIDTHAKPIAVEEIDRYPSPAPAPGGAATVDAAFVVEDGVLFRFDGERWRELLQVPNAEGFASIEAVSEDSGWMIASGVLWLLARQEWRTAAGIALVLLLAHFLPRPADPDRQIASDARPIRIIQPNIGQQDKWRPGFEEEAYRRLYALTITGPPVTPRLIFWPEAAVTEPLEDGRQGAERYTEAERLRATRALWADDVLLTGGLGLTSNDGQTVGGATNSVYVMQQIGQIRGRYDKAHLVPYGEYLPMRPLLEPLGLSRSGHSRLPWSDDCNG